MRNRLSTLVLLGMVAWCPCAAAADPPPSEAVQFTIRICEGQEQLKFWFNDEAKERWKDCQRPLAEVPVFIVTTSGQKGEGETGKDGVANLPEVTLSTQEKFRLGMACTTHRCLSLHDLFVGSPFVKLGSNMVYVETVPAPAPDPG